MSPPRRAILIALKVSASSGNASSSSEPNSHVVRTKNGGCSLMARRSFSSRIARAVDMKRLRALICHPTTDQDCGLPSPYEREGASTPLGEWLLPLSQHCQH